MQDIISQLASSKGEKSSKANIELAGIIAQNNDDKAVKILIDSLLNKNKAIQSDCIKTLYEIGYLNSELIAPYYQSFISLLNNKNNRMVWGAMIALATFTEIKHKEIFEHIECIMKIVEKGSVITKDCGVEILAKLSTIKQYSKITVPKLENILWNCPIKQLPMYIEKSFKMIDDKNRELFVAIIEKRMPDCEKDTQIKRLEKLLKKIKV